MKNFPLCTVADVIYEDTTCEPKFCLSCYLCLFISLPCGMLIFVTQPDIVDTCLYCCHFVSTGDVALTLRSRLKCVMGDKSQCDEIPHVKVIENGGHKRDAELRTFSVGS